MSSIISVENLSKKYTICHQQKERYTALRDVIMSKLAEAGRKICNPFSSRGPSDLSHEEFWALKNINFEIKKGDRVGIIGRNGAGKSTLLKILSRITEPTTGRITIEGKIASLLEVGTGFHPELTGRENIFLNGAILGMKRIEIKKVFDEIVDFAEIEKFLDTPVKRYSSGMYARLAFAVAAHLNPEILLVDEVLAVGDAQFQKKCIGKLQDVGKEGRTILFVSHNMATINALCAQTIFLDNGKIEMSGSTSEVILHYYSNGTSLPSATEFGNIFVGDEVIQLLSGAVKNDTGNTVLEIGIAESFIIEMRFRVLHENDFAFNPNFHFYTASGECAFVSHDTTYHTLKKGEYMAHCHIPANLLNEGSYFVGLAVTSFTNRVVVHFFEKNCLSFIIHDHHGESITRPKHSMPIPGVVRPILDWSLNVL